MSDTSINELFRQVILANELDNNLGYALRFSDPDGVRSGKSGWSYGVCQFDTRNNDAAIACLKECGFTDAEIKGIVQQTIEVKPLAARLAAHANIIAEYDAAQLSRCLKKAGNFANDRGIPLADTAALLAVADYWNQYGSMGDGAAKYFTDLSRPITAEDVLTFKLDHTKYGREHPGDCRRRYENIVKVIAEATHAG